MSSLMLINGVSMKNPSPLFSYEGEQLVDSARNANGVTVGTKVNRRLMKFSGLEWRGLTLAEWREIRDLIEDMYVDVTYFDEYAGRVITRKFYFGNCSSEVLEWDRSGDIMIPKIYKSCKGNLIDTGE